MNEAKPASDCTGPSDCSQVPAIESAVLNIGTAASDCGSARDAWIDANWNDAVMWINCAIAQLESARAKIQSHVANASLNLSGDEPE
jgi:hypothetical protein